MRREMIIGEGFPVGKDADGERRCEPGDFAGETRRRECIRAHDHEHPLLRTRLQADLRERERVCRSGKRRQQRPPAGRGNVGTSGGSAANGFASGDVSATGSRVTGGGAGAAVAASVEAVGMRDARMQCAKRDYIAQAACLEPRLQAGVRP